MENNNNYDDIVLDADTLASLRNKVPDRVLPINPTGEGWSGEALRSALSYATVDIIYILRDNFEKISMFLKNLNGEDDDGVINKLHEVVAFLNGYAEGTTLVDLLIEKVDKVDGKSLISDAEIARLAGVDNYDDTEIRGLITSLDTDKADVIHTHSNYTTEDAVQTKINTHNSSETAHTDIREEIEEARAIAEGKVSAMSFETKAELDAWLLIPENVETLIVGTNFYIEDLSSPDYWWNGTTLVELSTEKIDLTEYAKKSELLTLGTTENDAYRGDLGQIAYNHSQSDHAPANAQKNSDITKAEIEAKLTGEISSHSHALPSHNHDDRYYTETEVDTKLGGKANATHNHTKSEITDFPTIPTIPNISITNGTAEIGKYISQVAVDATDKHKLIVTKADLPQGFSGNYNDLTNKPTIPTVPTISTNITTDATSDTKTVSPKAVKTYVDNAISTALDNLLGGEY